MMESWEVDRNTTAFLCDDQETEIMIKRGARIVGKELSSRRKIVWLENKKVENLFQDN